MTLEGLIKKFGADAARIAIADAGDGVTDANFEEDVADNNILRLYNLREWCQEQVDGRSKLRSGATYLFYDKLFDNEMNCLIQECYSHYEATNYKLALKSALYDFTSARDFYREGTSSAGITMHRDLVLRYIKVQALLLAVIAPHWAEHIWLEVLGEPSTIQKALFPVAPEPDPALTAAYRYVRNISSNITSAEAAQLRKKAKGKDVGLDPTKPKKLTIFVAAKFPDWQEKYVDILHSVWDGQKMTIDEAKLMAEMKKIAGPELKKAMSFVQGLKRRLVSGEESTTVFNRKLAFSEPETLEQMSAGLKRAANLAELEIIKIDGEGNGVTFPGKRQVGTLPQVAEASGPGTPTFHFDNVVEK
jgi:leucyl-tRNA synthetase